jgi:hypothetical protein
MKNKEDEANSPAGLRLRLGLGGAVVAVCLAILTAQTWRKWGDMLVDYGVQLYLPWRLSTGEVLYRDVAYLTGGPLSQYYHSWLFRIFGVSVLTIVISNLVILVFLAAMLYWCFYRVSDVWTATVAGLALVLVFAFGQYGSDGTYTYLSPYSHEVVHGLVLSIVVLWLLSRWLLEGRIALALLAGVGVGLVLMTKPEVFLALALAQTAALALFWRGKHKPFLLARSVMALAGGAILPLAAFFLYFSRHESFWESLRSVLWAWVAVLTHAAPDNSFYRWCLGLDTPAQHVKMMARTTAGLAATVGGCAALCRLNLPGWRGNVVWALAATAIGYLALDFNWLQCGYGLPGACLACLGLWLWQAQKRGPGQVQPFPLLWSVFSLALLAKLGLFPRVWQYGFVLAMPAFLSAVYLLLWQLPSLLEKPGGQAGYFRAVVSLGLFIGMVQLWQDSQSAYEQRTVFAGSGADRMMFKPLRGSNEVSLGRVAGWLQLHTASSGTLAVLPEGAMLNYLLRRDNPTGYLRWNQTETTVFGEDVMTRSFMRAQPDDIILLQSTIAQTRIKSFGQDPAYGLALRQWIDAHYKPVYTNGPPTAVVYERK